MTEQEAKKCLSDGCPVIHKNKTDICSINGIIYDKVQAMIYRNGLFGPIISLELKDRRANSVTIAAIEDVEVAV